MPDGHPVGVPPGQVGHDLGGKVPGEGRGRPLAGLDHDGAVGELCVAGEKCSIELRYFVLVQFARKLALLSFAGLVNRPTQKVQPKNSLFT